MIISLTGHAALLSAAMLAAAPGAGDIAADTAKANHISADYVGFDQRIDDSRWSRYDFALTNHSAE